MAPLCLYNRSVYVQQHGIVTCFNNADIWAIMSKIEHSISEKISKYGIPLKEWDVQINFGIKTGFNDAFIITEEQRRQILQADEKSEEIIRPILRGRDVKRYEYTDAGLFLLFIPWHFPLHTNPNIVGASKEAEKEFEAQYPAVYKHLLQYKDKLSARNKAETGIRYEWYALQRWGANYWDDFNKQKIVWARLSRISKHDFYDFPRFAIVPKGFVTLDSLCFFTGDRLHDLVSFLNSRYAAYYFFNTVAILDNGGMQMRQQYVENIPLPDIQISEDLSEAEIDELIFEAFHFTCEETSYIKSFLEKKKKEIEDSRS